MHTKKLPCPLFAFAPIMFVLALLFCVAPVAMAQTSSSAPPDSRATRERVESLLKQMTLEEKMGQLSQLFRFDASKEIDDAVANGQVGSLLFITDPAIINQYQHLAVERTRLHIPLLFGFDVIHGFRTIFPVPIAMAASWDPSGAVREQTIAAKEARSVGIHWAFAPMVDIARDPRWGASSKAPAKTRIWVPPWPPARCAASRATTSARRIISSLA